MKKQHLFALALLCLSVIGEGANNQTITKDSTDMDQMGLHAAFLVSNMIRKIANADTKGKTPTR